MTSFQHMEANRLNALKRQLRKLKVADGVAKQPQITQSEDWYEPGSDRLDA
jgi:hypothetical protein